MKRVLVAMGLVAGVLLLAISVSSSFASFNKMSVCRRGGSRGRHWRRITADLQGEVYEVFHGEEASQFYGCVYGGRAYNLGQRGPSSNTAGEDVERFVLAGSVVAYYELDSERGGNKGGVRAFFVQVVNLRAGKGVYEAPTGASLEPKPVGQVGTGPATDIVVKSDGAVAWIAENYQEEEATGGHYYQVHELDKNGEQLLDSGAGIAPESLALAGSTIYWTDEGKPESAGLE